LETHSKLGDSIEVQAVHIPLIMTDKKVVGVASEIVEELTSLDTVSSEQVDSSSSILLVAREIRRARREEKSRLARVLHDDVSQSLATARTELFGFIEQEPHSNGFIHRAAHHLETASLRIRQEISDLIVNDIDVWEFLLKSSELLEETQRKSGIVTSLHLRASLDRLCTVSPSISTVLLGAVRELVRNCEKHSSADHCTVDLNIDLLTNSIVVTDDGVGFLNGHLGSGLTLLTERVENAGGHLEISTLGISGPRKGAVVKAEIPNSGGGR